MAIELLMPTHRSEPTLYQRLSLLGACLAALVACGEQTPLNAWKRHGKKPRGAALALAAAVPQTPSEEFWRLPSVVIGDLLHVFAGCELYAPASASASLACDASQWRKGYDELKAARDA